jgi:hypothetical protein
MRLPLLCAAALTAIPALALPFATASTVSHGPARSKIMKVPVVAEADAPLTGTYDCQGVEPDGTPYRGLVQISPNRGTYDVVWIFESGQQYAGLGVVNGDVLAVSYFTNRPGVVAYKIEKSEKGSRLEGQWTVVGAGAVFHETLTRMTRDVKKPEPPARPRTDRTPLTRYLRPA